MRLGHSFSLHNGPNESLKLHLRIYRVRCAMTKNDLMSSLESNSPFDYPILTNLVSFISICASIEVNLIHSCRILNLTDIDHVSIMKSSVFPTPKRGGITG